MAATGGASDDAPPQTAASEAEKLKLNLRRREQQAQQLLHLLSSATSATRSFLSTNDLLLSPSQTLTLESLLSSAASLLPLNLPSPIPPPQPPQCWFHRFVVAAASDGDPRWLHAFRMSKPTFTRLLRQISVDLALSLPSIPPYFALAAALFRLAHAPPYRAVARRFGLDSDGACRAFYTVSKLVNEKLGGSFDFRPDLGRILLGFGWISLPNCCGVLGFGRFGVAGEILGKNGSVMVQALVDSEGRFLDLSAIWPSTLKPETILHQTKLYSEAEESKRLFNGPSYKLWDGNSIPQYILGDSCFPLLPWLLTPYTKGNPEDSLSFSKTEFNSVHSEGMRLVNTAFARVRTRWKLLSRQWKEESLEFMPFVIVTGCLLHNFLINCNEPMPEENENVGCSREEGLLPPFDGPMDEGGARIRDALALHLAKVSLRR